jgi:hypothetical protein
VFDFVPPTFSRISPVTFNFEEHTVIRSAGVVDAATIRKPPPVIPRSFFYLGGSAALRPYSETRRIGFTRVTDLCNNLLSSLSGEVQSQPVEVES